MKNEKKGMTYDKRIERQVDVRKGQRGTTSAYLKLNSFFF